MQQCEANTLWTETVPTTPGYYWHRHKTGQPRLYFVGYPCENNTHNTTQLNPKISLKVCSASEKLTPNCVEPKRYGGLWMLAFTSDLIED